MVKQIVGNLYNTQNFPKRFRSWRPCSQDWVVTVIFWTRLFILHNPLFISKNTLLVNNLFVYLLFVCGNHCWFMPLSHELYCCVVLLPLPRGRGADLFCGFGGVTYGGLAHSVYFGGGGWVVTEIYWFYRIKTIN